MKQAYQYCQDLNKILFKDSLCQISIEEINSILTNSNLIEKSSFHVVRKGVYENYDCSNNHISEIQRVSEALSTGHTVIVKGLEMWGGAITKACNTLGNQVTAHMYISPPNGTGFNFHKDDTDVYVVMLYGNKTFDFYDQPSRVIGSSEAIYIPKELAHRAKSIGWSCHISFGVPKEYIKDIAFSYEYKIQPLFNLQKTYENAIIAREN